MKIKIRSYKTKIQIGITVLGRYSPKRAKYFEN